MESASDKPIANVEVCSGYPFKEKWDLVENLRLAAEDEGIEAERVYPEYQKTAEQEGFADIAGLFRNLIGIETCHKKLFTDLYNQMKSGTLYKKEQKTKWKCGGCGYEWTEKEAFEICPVCGAKQGVVMLKLADGE